MLAGGWRPGSACCRCRCIGTDRGAAESHLALGLAAEVAAALARFRWLLVVSASSLARDPATAGRRPRSAASFGLDFLLDGSVQWAWPAGFRITHAPAGLCGTAGPGRLGAAVRPADADERARACRTSSRPRWRRRSIRRLLNLDRAGARLAVLPAAVARTRPVQATAYDLVLRALPHDRAAATERRVRRRPAPCWHAALELRAGLRRRPCLAGVLGDVLRGPGLGTTAGDRGG